MNKPISVFIPVKNDKHLHDFLPLCLESLIKNVQHEIGEIVLVGENIPKMPLHVRIISEKDIHQKLNIPNVLSGWLRQQIYKLYADQFCDFQNILIVDADLCFLRPMHFFDGDRTFFNLEDEYYQPYFDTQEVLIGIPKIHAKSFIVDHMAVKSDKLSFLRQKIEEHTGQLFVYAIVKNANKHDQVLVEPFSEYELYGSMMMTYFADEVCFHSAPFNHCQHFLLIEPKNWSYAAIQAALSDRFWYLPALLRDSRASQKAKSLDVHSLGDWHQLIGYE